MSYLVNCRFEPGGVIRCETSNRAHTDADRELRHNPDSAFFYVPPRKRTGCVPWKVSRTKSFELRAGILHKGCGCVKSNGLQDKCIRSGCYENPRCSYKPQPACLPGRITREPYQDCEDMEKKEIFKQAICDSMKKGITLSKIGQKQCCLPHSDDGNCYKKQLKCSC